MPTHKTSAAIGEVPALFVLESPNKVRKVQGFIGANYTVTSSKGHIRTLGANRDLGIDISNNFAPTYVVDPKKTRVVSDLKSDLRQCDSNNIYLATDPDREGEAIAWHIAQVLGVDPLKCHRVTYTSITKAAVTKAVQNPGKLNMDMVHSQMARQVLDKLIGYELSPCLWKQFKNVRLSAGRVQSVVVRIITERELELASFNSSNYFKIRANFLLNNPSNMTPTDIAKEPTLDTELDAKITSLDEVSALLNIVDDKTPVFTLDEIKKSNSQRQPSAPFTTSTLQQEASNRLSMGPSVSMASAQRLYEAGHITYMRTDSTTLSPEGIAGCAKYIKNTYPPEYYRMKQYGGKKKNAQEGHEACRPTHLDKSTVPSTGKLTARDVKLYELIWKRTIASQMAPAKVEVNTAKVSLDTKPYSKTLHPDIYESANKSKYVFVGKYEKIIFDGFLRLYKPTNTDDNKEDESNTSSDTSSMEALFATLKKGSLMWPSTIDATEKQQSPPHPRYSEASLIKKLEDLGIGRPSTYASMVEKVQDRGYVEKKTIAPVEKTFANLTYDLQQGIKVGEKTAKVDGEKNKLHPTPLGMMINTFLLEKFDRLMDYEFTANVEEQLDSIANGKVQWHLIVKAVYDYVNPIVTILGAKVNNQIGGVREQIELGIHPTTGFPIKVLQTREGWAICEDHSGGDNKNPARKESRWASIGTVHPQSVTFEQALSLIDAWPKKLGMLNGKPVELHKAKSIYIKYDGQNFSIDMYQQDYNKDSSIGTAISSTENIDLTTATDIIKYVGRKKLAIETAKKERHTFEGNSDIAVLNGPYGYYIKYLGSINVKLPTKYKKDISALTKEEAEAAVKKHLEGSKLTVAPKSGASSRGRGRGRRGK